MAAKAGEFPQDKRKQNGNFLTDKRQIASNIPNELLQMGGGTGTRGILKGQTLLSATTDEIF